MKDPDPTENPEFEIASKTVPAPEPYEPDEFKLLDALIDAGVHIPNPAAALAQIEQAFDEYGDKRAGEALSFILKRLPGGKAGQTLRAALLGCLESGQDVADEIGETRQSFHQRVARLRKRILRKTLTEPS